MKKVNIIHTDFKIKVGNIISQRIPVITGLRQGNAFSPILFSIALERVNKESHIENNGYDWVVA